MRNDQFEIQQPTYGGCRVISTVSRSTSLLDTGVHYCWGGGGDQDWSLSPPGKIKQTYNLKNSTIDIIIYLTVEEMFYVTMLRMGAHGYRHVRYRLPYIFYTLHNNIIAVVFYFILLAGLIRTLEKSYLLLIVETRVLITNTRNQLAGKSSKVGKAWW